MAQQGFRSLFGGTTGYGYDDSGREILDQVYADIFGAEAALVRLVAFNAPCPYRRMFACLEPGEILLVATGAPYDTLRGAIGIGSRLHRSLSFYGIGYDQADLPEAAGRPERHIGQGF